MSTFIPAFNFFLRLLLFSVVTHTAWAGDAAALYFVGFSQDGKYLAFQEYGVTDGEGAAYANTYFLEVKSNKYAAKPIRARVPDADEGAEYILQEQNLTAANERLAELDIIDGNQGTQVIANSIYELSANHHRQRFAVGLPLAGSPHEIYHLSLEQQPAEAECFGLGQAKKFTLTVMNEYHQTPQVLQQDKAVPKSRGCPLGYRIQDVYLYQNKQVVVFLNVFKPGFEGQNMRFMAISAELQ